jgi:hypothetical protein
MRDSESRPTGFLALRRHESQIRWRVMVNFEALFIINLQSGMEMTEMENDWGQNQRLHLSAITKWTCLGIKTYTHANEVVNCAKP